MPVQFFSENIPFKLSHPKDTQSWIQRIVEKENKTIEDINYIFCNDEYLLDINKKYLEHDSYTDIITFDQSDDPNSISGDIFISIDRVRDNANKMETPFENELKRVMIHGVLHLLGYDDKTEEEKNNMRKKEEACLSLY